MVALNASGQSAKWFIGFLVAYVVAMTALRSHFDLRYDDTTVAESFLARNSYDKEKFSKDILEWPFWKAVFTDGRAGPGAAPSAVPQAYRPLQFIYSEMAAYLYFRSGPALAIFFCFVLLGLSGYLVFRLFESAAGPRLAWICASAYLFFPAVVSPAWVPLAGPQSMIPGAFAGGLLAYLRYLRTERKEYLIALAGICAIGPLFKETIAILPFLLLAHHLLVAPVKRPGVLLGLSLACLHGVFPATVIILALKGEICLVGTAGRGTVGGSLSLRGWRPGFPMDLAGFIPPSLLLVSLASIACHARLKAPVLQLTLPARWWEGVVPWLRMALSVMASITILAMVGTMLGQPLLPGKWLGLLTFLTIGLNGALYLDLLVTGWFLCMFLPLLKIYFNVTQCGYVAAPLVYLVVAPMFHVSTELGARHIATPLQRAMRYALMLIGILSFFDNALSVPNSWIAYRDTGRFDDTLLAQDLRQALAHTGSADTWTYIDNTVVADDAAILSTEFRRGRALYNFRFGVPAPCVIESEAQLQAILSAHNCVLIVADFVNPSRVDLWDLRDIRSNFQEVHEQQVSFDGYYADPLRLLVDNRYRSMMATPDFQDEFARESPWFRERFSNTFHVYVRAKGPADLAGIHFEHPGK